MEPKKRDFYDPDNIANRIARAEKLKVKVMEDTRKLEEDTEEFDEPLPKYRLTTDDKLYLRKIGIKA